MYLSSGIVTMSVYCLGVQNRNVKSCAGGRSHGPAGLELYDDNGTVLLVHVWTGSGVRVPTGNDVSRMPGMTVGSIWYTLSRRTERPVA